MNTATESEKNASASEAMQAEGEAQVRQEGQACEKGGCPPRKKTCKPNSQRANKTRAGI
jgi:hypothetical protein